MNEVLYICFIVMKHFFRPEETEPSPSKYGAAAAATAATGDTAAAAAAAPASGAAAENGEAADIRETVSSLFLIFFFSFFRSPFSYRRLFSSLRRTIRSRTGRANVAPNRRSVRHVLLQI